MSGIIEQKLHPPATQCAQICDLFGNQDAPLQERAVNWKVEIVGPQVGWKVRVDGVDGH